MKHYFCSIISGNGLLSLDKRLLRLLQMYIMKITFHFTYNYPEFPYSSTISPKPYTNINIETHQTLQNNSAKSLRIQNIKYL